MIVKTSDQVSRFTWLKRFPIPRNFNVNRVSRRDAHGLHLPAQRGRRRSTSIATIPIPATTLASTSFMSTSTTVGRWFWMR